MQRYFLRMGSDPIDNAKTVLDFVTLQLQQNKQQSDQQLGEPLRPWALVFVKQMTLFEGALEAIRQNMLQDTSLRENRQWLDGIRVCQIESVHELRAVLCALHLKGEASPQQQQQGDIVSWMENAHDGQPPCLVVVMDLLQLLSSSSTRAQPSNGQQQQHQHQRQRQRHQHQNNGQYEEYTDSDNCVQVRQDELCSVLALLVETCHYLTVYKRKTWDDAFGCHTEMTTDLLITDSQYLADRPVLGLPDQQSLAIDRLYRILSYYVDSVHV